MLKKVHNLYFPEMVCVGETSLKINDEESRTLPIYKLDWTEKEIAVGKKHEAWLRKYHPDTKMSIVGFYGNELPSPYGSWINEMQYVISPEYKREIRRCAEQALGEWNIKRPFDTSIREMCLGPAIEFVKIAFRLLADCAYDPKTNYYYRKSDKRILSPALLYKFWINQTGGGMTWFHAGLDYLERLLKENEYGKTWEVNDPERKEIKEFLVEIVDQEQIINDKFARVMVDNEEIKEKK